MPANSANQPHQPQLQIVRYQPRYRAAFRTLNIAWLDAFFVVEDIDEAVLSNPESYILNKGGQIFFALHGGMPVGCAALKHDGDGVYEFTKFAVDAGQQGKGVGAALMEAALKAFEAAGGVKLFLETNTKLEAARTLYDRYGWQEVAGERVSPYARCNCTMVWRGWPNQAIPQTNTADLKNKQAPSAPATGSIPSEAAPTCVTIRLTESAQDIAAATQLVRDFTSWLPVDLAFQNLDKELAELAAKYSHIFLADLEVDGTKTPVGIVALYDLGTDAVGRKRCEMKRLYVSPKGRGFQVGEALCTALMAAAKEAGYSVMVLDTLARLPHAVALYRRLGFQECAPYYHNPEPDVIYMEKTL